MNHCQRGSILIVALWTLAFLGALALQIGAQGMMRLTAARHLMDRTVASQQAYGKFQEALAEFKSKTPEERQKPFSGDGYEVSDEASKISLNGASLEMLTAVVAQCRENSDSAAETIAAAIVDWRDADEDDTYPCKNAPFESPEEMLLVPGIRWAMFQKLKDLVTTVDAGAVNLNSSTQEVLESMGMSAGLAEKVVAYTRGDDSVLGTGDDRPFSSVGAFAEELQQWTALTSEETAEAAEMAASGFFTAGASQYFCIKATGIAAGKGRSRQIIGVVDANGKILTWSER